MTHSLPERPNLEQLKKQTKDLLRAVHDGDPAALKRAGRSATKNESFALHDAQRIVAREYGFPSWAKLKLHVETRTDETAASRLIDAALAGEPDVVEAILSERPQLATHLAVAAALGDDDVVLADVARDRSRATATIGPRWWPVLLYLCFGRCGGDDHARARAAQRLLELGADPNANWIHETWPESPLPALYGATGVNNYPELARILLRAGANPNDSESRYHAAEHNHVACLEVLAEFGTNFSGADKLWGNTPLCFLLGSVHPAAAVRAGVTWLIKHGANPNVRSYADTVNEAPLHVAVRNDWDASTLALMLEHGADPNARRADGRTPYALALIFGREQIAALLRERGADLNVAPVDAFLGTCMRADAKTVRAMLRDDPSLVRTIAPADFNIVEVAAREDRADALALMNEIGMDLTRPINEGATALHWACWHGRARATRVLLAAGADKNACDDRFKAPPIGWCAHGSQFAGAHTADYAGVAEALIAAGAFVPPNTEGSSEVMAVLRKHGIKTHP